MPWINQLLINMSTCSYSPPETQKLIDITQTSIPVDIKMEFSGARMLSSKRIASKGCMA